MCSSLKILLIDDDPALVKTLTLFLQYLGYQVFPTNDPVQAFNIAQIQSLDLLIVDMFMSQMDGLELLKRCRQMQQNLPAILITGQCDRLIEYPEIYTHFQAILPKPLDIDRLIEELKLVYPGI
jgi:CheY-like chemotaxis protein